MTVLAPQSQPSNAELTERSRQGLLEEYYGEILSLRAKVDELTAREPALVDLVQTLLDNDPNEPIADNGMTVLDGWRDRARGILGPARGPPCDPNDPRPIWEQGLGAPPAETK